MLIPPQAKPFETRDARRYPLLSREVYEKKQLNHEFRENAMAPGKIMSLKNKGLFDRPRGEVAEKKGAPK
jgi:hypothetical protein